MTDKAKPERSKFPPLYWLVVVFEFFERGSYYGMMSVLSVYLTDELSFSKPDVGLIKSTIQPLLYFLPILSGALADRFGFRRALMVAFALLGGGYFLTSQATEYAAVFLSLVVMGVGAGVFKPVISGSIARCTDQTNSAMGFGIYYWSINLGAFLFPLVLVPYLKNNIGWDWVIIASAIGTGAMLIPTFLFFREPPKPQEDKPAKERASLFQTLANAFEIIYSGLVLLVAMKRRSPWGGLLMVALLASTMGYGGWSFLHPEAVTTTFAARVYPYGATTLEVQTARNLCKADPYIIRAENNRVTLTLYDPDRLDQYAPKLLEGLRATPALAGLSQGDLERFAQDTSRRIVLDVAMEAGLSTPFRIQRLEDNRFIKSVASQEAYEHNRDALLKELQVYPELSALSADKLDDLVGKAGDHPFLLLFVGMMLAGGLVILRIEGGYKRASSGGKAAYLLGTMAVMLGLLWLLPGLSLFARILCSVISTTLLALYLIDYRETTRFKDHLRFLVMIIIYSGFWVLYFQMFDSVLWYVQAYVDASSLNEAVNGVLVSMGLEGNWRFDVEHVTVINAATIILLQLVISAIVKNAKALPTMIVGITMATTGMAILAISTGIWVFIAGIVMFSIGEMTTHPKFISYVGQTAPKDKVAMYMGYLFLYGVMGSSVGGVVGANLYVKFVDQMNQPRTLWLIFTGIGVATIIGLLIYNKVGAREERG